MPILPIFDLTGRLALVTGSSGGIGLAIAAGLADAGAHVILNGRDADRLEHAAATLRETAPEGGARTVLTRAFDVTDRAAVEAGVRKIEDADGPIRILVNNAGIQRRAPLDAFPPEDWAELMRTNLDSVFFVGTAVARHMIPRGAGKIINIGSVQCELARPGIAPYTASKGAVKNLTKGMCADWARHGLQVNAIGPGYFETPLNRALVEDPEFNAWLKKRTPAGRWGRVEELQGAAVFLASDASSFVNGQTLYVDGGVLSVL
ncbi:SDR family oxidoreductase [Nguyenibacter sp. L1]|uniref:SDR family oxidoreductase n=1 Tax=Nguyenibacter sp. L1 TaxID=3049350 RepID=UPI002B495B0B|nr:SDR family oxidoreductase [Nguyenibacter sp. L1]WRH87286.1 SDR family oxidoreductase [Nguyenibacter sp. L1]